MKISQEKKDMQQIDKDGEERIYFNTNLKHEDH